MAVTEEQRFARVLADAQAGHDTAMRALFTGVHPRLVRYLRAMEPTMADDLAGEVWMGVARGLHRFEGDEGAFLGWVFSIARRRVSEHRRRSWRGSAEPRQQSEFDSLPCLDDPESSVVGRLSGAQAAELLATMLSPDQAEVVLLRVLADLDVDEVAELMGRTPNWVRVTQHRALQRLADRVGSRIDVIR